MDKQVKVASVDLAMKTNIGKTTIKSSKNVKK
jgi:hypothetical protein